MRHVVIALVCLCTGMFVPVLRTQAAVAIIVHPSVTLKNVEINDIRRVFLGKTKLLADKLPIVPLNLSANNSARNEFNTKVLFKSESQLKAYWVKLIFTGNGSPPRSVENGDDALKLIAQNTDLIGYVDSGMVNESVRVLLMVE